MAYPGVSETEEAPIGPSDGISELERIASRLIPFAPRSTVRGLFSEKIDQYGAKLKKLSALFNEKLTCPLCKSSKDVIIIGSRKNGTKKHKCKNCTSQKNVPGRQFSTLHRWKHLKSTRNTYLNV